MHCHGFYCKSRTREQFEHQVNSAPLTGCSTRRHPECQREHELHCIQLPHPIWSDSSDASLFSDYEEKIPPTEHVHALEDSIVRVGVWRYESD